MKGMVWWLLASASVIAASTDGAELILSTGTVGRKTTKLMAQSQSLVALSLRREAVESAKVTRVEDDRLVFTRGSVWESDQWAGDAGAHVAVIGSGQAEGHSFTIRSHSGNALTLETGEFSLVTLGVEAGDLVRIHPRWTLGTAFPPEAFNSPTGPVDPEHLSGLTLHRLLVPATSINPTASESWIFRDGAWRSASDPDGPATDNSVLAAGDYLIVRNENETLWFSSFGDVTMHANVVLLSRRVDGPVDNTKTVLNPLPVTLRDSGLIESAAFRSSIDGLRRSDMVVVYDYSEPGDAPAVIAFYIYHGGGWRKLGEPLHLDFGSDLLQGPHRAAFIRTGSQESAETVVWRHEPIYLR